MDTTRLYYECHITLEPVYGIRLTILEHLVAKRDLSVSTFLMVKPGQQNPDAFVSLRDKSYANVLRRMCDACIALEAEGFVIKRAKIEDTLLDTKHGDARPWI